MLKEGLARPHRVLTLDRADRQPRRVALPPRAPGVVDQVPQHLPKARSIDLDRWDCRIAQDTQFDRWRDAGLQFPADGLDERAEILYLRGERLHAAERQELVGKRSRAVRSRGDRFDV